MLYKFCTRMMSNSDEFLGHGHKRMCEYMKFVKTGLARLTGTVPRGEGDNMYVSILLYQYSIVSR